jgi:hypothetical protein
MIIPLFDCLSVIEVIELHVFLLLILHILRKLIITAPQWCTTGAATAAGRYNTRNTLAANDASKGKKIK